MNITDGLDGLAIGLMVIAGGALTVLAYTSGNRELAELSATGAQSAHGGVDHFLRIA